MVGRYKTSVKYWNICNEPYIYKGDCYNGPIDTLHLYLRISSEVIKDEDDSAKVVAPDIPQLVNSWEVADGDTVLSNPDSIWGEILDNGGANYIDVISVHQYDNATPSQVFQNLDSLKTLLNNHGAGDKPVWITETGENTDSGLQHQAQWYRGFCEEMLEDTILDKVFFFALKWGILNANWSHRPAYDTLKEWILPPAAPTGLSDTVKAYPPDPDWVIIWIDWDANSESDLEGYKVYHKLHSQSQFSLEATTTNTYYYEKVHVDSTHDYYVTAYDEAGSESDPSDTITVIAKLKASPFVFAWSGTEFVMDNSILPASEIVSGVNADYYKFETLEEQNNEYLLQIIESGSHHTYLDQARLLAVDHPEDEELSIGTTSDGEIIAYEETASPISCKDNHGIDWLDSVKTVGDGYYSSEDGDWLDLDFGEVDEEEQVIIVGTWMAAKSALHVQIQEDDEWEDVGIIYPRAMYSTTLVNLSEFDFDGKVRIYCEGNAVIDYVALAESETEDITIRECPLKRAIHSEESSVKQELLNIDEDYAEIMPGDTVTLAFTPIGKRHDHVRDFVLVSTGYYEHIKGTGGTMSAGSEVLSSTFELCGGYPNPLNSETQIKFAIPEEAQVNLGIYDVTGRLVKNLVNKNMEAGYHTITWQPKGLASGIYFAKLKVHADLGSDSYADTKKLILLR